MIGGSSKGFTMLEIMLVLFLIVGMLSLVIPRISVGENLGTVARRWVGAMKSFQEMAMITQKTVRLYVDMDRGMYWPMVVEGNEAPARGIQAEVLGLLGGGAVGLEDEEGDDDRRDGDEDGEGLGRHACLR